METEGVRKKHRAREGWKGRVRIDRVRGLKRGDHFGRDLLVLIS